jgi:hypothetical protein
MPITVNEDLVPAASTSRRVEPFIGSRLRDWAASCVASPYGFLYSGVAERTAVTMRSSRGESFEVAAIGSIELGPDLPQVVLDDWLYTQARDRGIEVCTDSPLQRIVFEDGHVLELCLMRRQEHCRWCPTWGAGVHRRSRPRWHRAIRSPGQHDVTGERRAPGAQPVRTH